MTIAICMSCGAEKFGALVKCKNYNFEPCTKDDIAEVLILEAHKIIDDLVIKEIK